MDAGKCLRKKLNTRSGFTLAETLLAILIMLMVSSIVAAGIPVARNAYENVVLASNAEVLLSTTISTLRNELGTAKDVSAHDQTITYFNEYHAYTSEITVEDFSLKGAMVQTIMYRRFAEDANLMLTDKERSDYEEYVAIKTPAVRLISTEASTADLYATYSSVTDNHDGTFTFSGFCVMKAGRAEPLTETRDVVIRVISE